MKTQIFPTLFALNKEEFETKLKTLSFCKDIHIDFMDGEFVNSKSIDIYDMKNLTKYKKNYEIHLMAKNPVQYLKPIKALGISKVLIQFEAFDKFEDLLFQATKFKEHNLKLFLVVNPSTEIGDYLDILDHFDGIMFMSVWPGKEGQEFIEDILIKIQTLRKLNLNIKIQVDGGIKISNAKKIALNGANILSIGSAISSAKNPKERYAKFKSFFT